MKKHLHGYKIVLRNESRGEWSILRVAGKEDKVLRMYLEVNHVDLLRGVYVEVFVDVSPTNNVRIVGGNGRRDVPGPRV